MTRSISGSKLQSVCMALRRRGIKASWGVDVDPQLRQPKRGGK